MLSYFLIFLQIREIIGPIAAPSASHSAFHVVFMSGFVASLRSVFSMSQYRYQHQF